MSRWTTTFASILVPCMLMGSGQAIAEEAEPAANLNAQANNPLANMKAFNLQDYYIGDLTESNDDANQFWVRAATPISIGDTTWITRASLPVNSYPVGSNGSTETGLGDLNIISMYLFDTQDPALSFAIGPQLTAPTATEDGLGSEQWSAGLANMMFDARSKTFQWGYLLTWQHSFAGDDDWDDVNFGAFQYFAFYQLGGGTYLRSAPAWAYNFENDNYSVPLGLGIGQVIKRGKTVYNMFIEPQFSVADDGPGQPEWQVFLGFHMQFL